MLGTAKEQADRDAKILKWTRLVALVAVLTLIVGIIGVIVSA